MAGRAVRALWLQALQRQGQAGFSTSRSGRLSAASGAAQKRQGYLLQPAGAGGVEKVQGRNEGSWEMLSVEEALRSLDQMTGMPSVDKFICVVQKCRKNKNLDYANRVHAHICGIEVEAHRIALGNYVVPMFVECGSVFDAQQVFNTLVHPNEHSWTSLILGYVECGQSQHALDLYRKMHEAGVRPSRYTFMALFKACARLKDVGRGREFHFHMRGMGYERDIFIANALVDMYAKCGSFGEARQVLNKICVRDVVSWNALISGYVEHGLGEEALKCAEEMQLEGLSPNAVTFTCILKGCGGIVDVARGREIHAEIKKKGLEGDKFISNTLVDMYAKCGSLAEARNVLDKMSVRDAVSWNALIGGYVEHGFGEEALKCAEQMQLEGVFPDAVTFICSLKACGSLGAIDRGREIHANIMKSEFQRGLVVANALVDMYAKCGSFGEAVQVLENMPTRNVVSWNTIIGGYAEHGFGQEALKCLGQMREEGVSPNPVTFICVLKACGSMGAIETGREIHSEIAVKGLERNLVVSNALIEMYAKCGSVAEAREVFDKLPVRDVISWSAMIKAYGTNHEGNMAVQCFEEMQQAGIGPDAITFTCLLGACSHSGLVFKGREYFRMMREKYGIAPEMDHYNGMVDLLARSGHLYEAEKLVQTMPFPPCDITWKGLLSACKTFGELKLGLRCFQRLVEMNPQNASAYVLMANAYASAGRWDDAKRIEELRKQVGANKKPASALIEVNKVVHEFVVGNNQNEQITAMLENLSTRIKEEGYVPNVNLDLRPMSDEKKEAALCEHAEKLAIAFGLLNTPQGQTLRVTKNLRMCNDCHNASKSVSRIEKRELIVRDGYRVHHFKNGLCSCKDMC